MIDWVEIQGALQEIFLQGSGLSSEKVLWANQNGPRPAPPFITLLVESIVPLGAVDSVTYETDLTKPQGQEIIVTVSGHRELTLSVQCYSNKSVGNNSAIAILSRTQTSLRLPSTQEILNPKCVGLFEVGTIQDISSLLDTKIESRAIMSPGFYLSENVSETVTYIQNVELTETETQETFLLTS